MFMIYPTFGRHERFENNVPPRQIGVPTGLGDGQTAQVVWIGFSTARFEQKPDSGLGIQSYYRISPLD